MNKCIRMGITASNLSFGEVNRRFYGRKLRFTAPLTRRRKTKFPTVKPPIYLPKCQIWMQLSPNLLRFRMCDICTLTVLFVCIKRDHCFLCYLSVKTDNLAIWNNQSKPRQNQISRDTAFIQNCMYAQWKHMLIRVLSVHLKMFGCLHHENMPI